jgi:LytS/YehU family sensor histidine kinase
LANATRRIIPMAQEIDFLHSYMRLEQMRFPDKFEYLISCDDFKDEALVFLPPMLVQPYAENAIRHGFKHLETKGKLSIHFEKAAPDLLKCTIRDNGTGRNEVSMKKEFSVQNDRLHGTTITETRVRLLNPDGFTDKYQIIYTDLSENGRSCGLKVELFLPLEKGFSEIRS